MFDKNDFQKLIVNPDFYNKELIYFIQDGKDSIVNSIYNSYTNYVADLPNAIEKKTCIKVQGVENYNVGIMELCHEFVQIWQRCVDCHAYWGFAGTGSFDMHTDPNEVCILVLQGLKEIHFEDTMVPVPEGERIFIPANKPHRAFNLDNTLSLSISSYPLGHESSPDLGIKL